MLRRDCASAAEASAADVAPRATATVLRCSDAANGAVKHTHIRSPSMWQYVLAASKLGTGQRSRCSAKRPVRQAAAAQRAASREGRRKRCGRAAGPRPSHGPWARP
eukprot:15438450-Alexandrium_andersonii.AAC.1